MCKRLSKKHLNRSHLDYLLVDFITNHLVPVTFFYDDLCRVIIGVSVSLFLIIITFFFTIVHHENNYHENQFLSCTAMF